MRLEFEHSVTPIAGLYLLSTQAFFDERGKFKKLVSKEIFDTLSLESNFIELYYSISKKDVIRGMHFQSPPMDCVKVVYVAIGKIRDVCLDLRLESKTYGKFFSCVLSGNGDQYLYIPKGIAHGFATLEDNSIVNYAQTACYSKTHDLGIRYDSFGFDWHITKPIISERDKDFPEFQNWNTVF
jgi:dTDP-4-dehydrorhamnose 3,5-epimerase/CDP-3, 6-dideoxy-D-glycero-D-glycero-4-hexulose-5-epimerase